MRSSSTRAQLWEEAEDRIVATNAPHMTGDVQISQGPVPGTLRVRGVDGMPVIPVVDANGDPFAYVPLSLGAERAEAQANLIAEAPGLLDTLRQTEVSLGPQGTYATLRGFLRECRRAITQLKLRQR